MSIYKEAFYLGANTSKGFVSLYNQLSEDKTQNKIFIIKGGPGTGKSTIMKKIGEHFSERYNIEYNYCSSDPDSLDVVTIKELGVSILDGTPPHPMEPKFPGAFESIVDLYPFWNEEGLEKSRSEIERITKLCSNCHKKAVRYISIADILSNNNMLIQESALEKVKIKQFVDRLMKKLLLKKGESNYCETLRFLSAVTPKGVYACDDNLENYEKIYVIEDDYGAVSSFILEGVRNTLLKSDYKFITCYCVLAPFQKIEHILIPEIKTAFVTSNTFHDFKIYDKNHVIRSKRFVDKEIIKDNKQKLRFNSEVKNDMINQAVKSMKEAKSHHDELEKLYTVNVDFKDMSKIVDKLINKIESKI